MKKDRLKSHVNLFMLACILLLTGSLVLSSPVYGAESSCVKCHTNDQLLKSLHKPPKVTTEEGEG